MLCYHSYTCWVYYMYYIFRICFTEGINNFYGSHWKQPKCCLYIVASELKDPIWHSSEWQIGSFSSEATIWAVENNINVAYGSYKKGINAAYGRMLPQLQLLKTAACCLQYILKRDRIINATYSIKATKSGWNHQKISIFFNMAIRCKHVHRPYTRIT